MEAALRMGRKISELDIDVLRNQPVLPRAERIRRQKTADAAMNRRRRTRDFEASADEMRKELFPSAKRLIGSPIAADIWAKLASQDFIRRGEAFESPRLGIPTALPDSLPWEAVQEELQHWLERAVAGAGGGGGGGEGPIFFASQWRRRRRAG
uniref:Uncharacterized protein n=1 Tax=Heterosigma akashiwo TaxID=2829 RepID=A0A7S3XQX7_HETAK